MSPRNSRDAQKEAFDYIVDKLFQHITDERRQSLKKAFEHAGGTFRLLYTKLKTATNSIPARDNLMLYCNMNIGDFDYIVMVNNFWQLSRLECSSPTPLEVADWVLNLDEQTFYEDPRFDNIHEPLFNKDNINASSRQVALEEDRPCDKKPLLAHNKDGIDASSRQDTLEEDRPCDKEPILAQTLDDNEGTIDSPVNVHIGTPEMLSRLTEEVTEPVEGPHLVNLQVGESDGTMIKYFERLSVVKGSISNTLANELFEELVENNARKVKWKRSDPDVRDRFSAAIDKCMPPHIPLVFKDKCTAMSITEESKPRKKGRPRKSDYFMYQRFVCGYHVSPHRCTTTGFIGFKECDLVPILSSNPTNSPEEPSSEVLEIPFYIEFEGEGCQHVNNISAGPFKGVARRNLRESFVQDPKQMPQTVFTKQTQILPMIIDNRKRKANAVVQVEDSQMPFGTNRCKDSFRRESREVANNLAMRINKLELQKIDPKYGKNTKLHSFLTGELENNLPEGGKIPSYQQFNSIMNMKYTNSSGFDDGIFKALNKFISICENKHRQSNEEELELPITQDVEEIVVTVETLERDITSA